MTWWAAHHSPGPSVVVPGPTDRFRKLLKVALPVSMITSIWETQLFPKRFCLTGGKKKNFISQVNGCDFISKRQQFTAVDTLSVNTYIHFPISAETCCTHQRATTDSIKQDSIWLQRSPICTCHYSFECLKFILQEQHDEPQHFLNRYYQIFLLVWS